MQMMVILNLIIHVIHALIGCIMYVLEFLWALTVLLIKYFSSRSPNRKPIHFALNCSRNSTNPMVFHLFEYFNKTEVSKNAI